MMTTLSYASRWSTAIVAGGLPSILRSAVLSAALLAAASVITWSPRRFVYSTRVGAAIVRQEQPAPRAFIFSNQSIVMNPGWGIEIAADRLLLELAAVACVAGAGVLVIGLVGRRVNE